MKNRNYTEDSFEFNEFNEFDEINNFTESNAKSQDFARPQDSKHLQWYLGQVKDCDQLSREEEVALAKRAHAGDRRAEEKLAKSQLKLVVGIAKACKRQGWKMSVDDMIGFGNIGLVEAIRDFDETRGCRLSTFATNYVRNSIMNALPDDSFIRIPKNFGKEKSEVRKAIERIERRGTLNPTDEEIAEESGLSVKAVQNVKCFTPKYVELTVTYGDNYDDEKFTEMDRVASEDLRPDEIIEERETYNTLHVAVNNLKTDYSEIVNKVFFQEKKVKKIAEQQGRKPQNIYKKLEKAFAQLRENPYLEMGA